MPVSRIASASRLPGARSISASAAPSPIEMPLRSAAYGRQGRLEISPSELKPYSVVRHSESTPPTMAASIRPAAIMRRADANTLALDEQADDTAAAGPSSRSQWRVKSAAEKVLCE